MTNWAQAERSALADLFATLGPDQPTLCEGWTTRDLAAHLVVRERRPDAAAGLLVKPLSGHLESVQTKVASQAWPDLIAEVRHTPKWSPYAIGAVDRLVNTIEFYVHHEDVRHAQEGWEPRSIDPELEADLWHRLTQGARLMGRRAPSGVVLRHTDGSEVRAKKGEPAAVVAGPAAELVLFLTGRQSHARVEIDADDDVAEQLRTAKLGV